MPIVILYAFMVVSSSTYSTSHTVYREWQNVGGYYSMDACNNARESLGEKFKAISRCVSTR